MPPERHTSWMGLAVAATTSGMLRAQILKTKLEEAGIEVALDYESAGPLFGITASGLLLSQVRLLVAEKDAEAAQQILNTPPPPGWDTEDGTAEPDPQSSVND